MQRLLLRLPGTEESSDEGSAMKMEQKKMGNGFHLGQVGAAAVWEEVGPISGISAHFLGVSLC